MEFGVVTAKIDEIGYITHAENLGYRHCWVTDSPIIRSNCWAVLALAAQATRTMRIGTGVSVPGLRLAPVAANGIATINRLALEEASPAQRHQRLHASHYSFVDPDEARFITADLNRASCLTGTPDELMEQIRRLEREGLRQIMLYPPLNRQYRVIEDFAARVMSRL